LDAELVVTGLVGLLRLKVMLCRKKPLMPWHRHGYGKVSFFKSLAQAKYLLNSSAGWTPWQLLLESLLGTATIILCLLAA